MQHADVGSRFEGQRGASIDLGLTAEELQGLPEAVLRELRFTHASSPATTRPGDSRAAIEGKVLALRACVGHLGTDWTADAAALKEGHALARTLEEEAQRCESRAARLR